MLPAQPNQSLIDGLACLQALAMAGEPVGSRELGRQLGLEPTRANRLLKTLAHLGIAAQTADRQYVPGPGMHVIAAQSLFGSGLLQRAIGPLEQLRAFEHTVALGVLWQTQVCYLYHADPGMPAAAALGRVGLFPATASGIGLALLSRRDEAEVAGLYAEQSLAPFKNVGALQRALRVARRQEYSIAQVAPGWTSIGVAIGEVPYAAIAISGQLPESKFTVLAAALREAAEAIEARSAPAK